MKADRIFVEYWSEILKENRHFFICSKCYYALKESVMVCPNCGSELSHKVMLPKRRKSK